MLAERSLLVAAVLALGYGGWTEGAAAQAEVDTVPQPRYEIAPLVVDILPVPTRTDLVPYAVTVLDLGQRAASGSGLALDEALRRAPGVQVDNRFNYALGERISVRGFGARAQFGVRGLRALVDGIPATFADGQSALDVVDPGLVRGVEIARGPASAHHGNAAGGVIVFRTVPPPASGHEQRLRLSAGSAGTRRLEGGLGGRTGGLGYRASASNLGFAGYRPHNESRVTRASARFDLGRTLQVNAHASDFAADNPGSLSEEQLAEDRFQAFAGNVSQGTGKTGRQGQVGATWSAGLGDAVLDATLYGIARDIVNPIPGVIIGLDRRAAGGRVGVRRGDAAAPGPTWVAGVESAGQWDDRVNYRNVGGERGALTLDQRERVASVSPFGSVGWTAGRLTAAASLRYDRFGFRADDRFGAGADDQSGARVMSAISPAAGVTVAVIPELRVFGNVATSFETPTTTELANRPDGSRGFNPDLEPQTTRSVELGARFARAEIGEVEATVYRADVRNSLVPFQTDGGRDFYRNAGAARHRGVELSGRVWPTTFLTSGAVYTHTDARFRVYEAGGVDLSGNRAPGVAPHRVAVFADLHLGGHEVGLDARARSALPVDDANEHEAPGHLLFDLRVEPRGVMVGRSTFRPFLTVTNLLGTDHVTSVVPNAFGGRFYEPGPRRMLFLGGTVRLGG